MRAIVRKYCWKTHDCTAAKIRKVPCLRALFQSAAGEGRCIKCVTGFIYGLLLGFAFYSLILVDLDFPPDICLLVAFIITLMIAIGNAVSTQIRCICLLTLPAFCGRAGRGVLKALVIAYVMAGPLANLGTNGREVVRVFACTTTLSFNLTRARFDLMLRPFIDGLLNMKADVNEAKQTLRAVRDLVVPVAEELEGEEEMRRVQEENDYLDAAQGDSKRTEEIARKYASKPGENDSAKIERRYARKLETRCEEMMSKSGERCRKAFSDAYDRCYYKVTFLAAWLLCWPMKLTFVCNIVEAIGGAKTCDVAKHLDPGIGEGYLFLKKTRTQLSEGFKEARMQYKLGKLPPSLDILEAKDTAITVMHEFESKKKFVDYVMSAMKRLLAFVFIRILLSAQDYHDKFVTDIKFDNVYLTRYFRHVDARRRRREQLCLLPLRKNEKVEFVDPYGLCLQPRERLQMLPMSLRLLLEMLTPTAFVLMDLLLYEAMDLVRRHAHIEYTQTGKHDLTLRVLGTGFLARIVRSVLRSFTFRQRLRAVRSNTVCLPQPHRLEFYYYYKIFGSYLVIWLLIFGQAYTQRLQRAICAYFYPKREKKRVIFLYNETLKRRIGMARHLKAVVRRKAREHRLQVDASFLAALRIRCPRWCSWLRVFRAARRKCLVCFEVEPFRETERQRFFIDCPNITCHAVYCKICWYEAGQVCYVCSFEDDSETEEDSGWSKSESADST